MDNTKATTGEVESSTCVRKD